MASPPYDNTGFVAYDNFMRAVVPHCTGVAEIVAYDAVRNAAIEFCEESHWLQFSPTAQDGISNQAIYTIETPTDTRLVAVTSAWWNNNPILPRSPDQLESLFGQDWRTMTGDPSYYTRVDNNAATLNHAEMLVVPYPVSYEPAALTAILTICPLRDSTTCAGDLYERWMEVIAHGALARLQSTPRQSYSNDNQAAMHAKMFKAGISRAKIDRNRGMERGPINMRPPNFV